MRRELCFELARVTENAALAAAPLIGKGNKNSVDGAAVDAMRHILNTLDIKGEIVIGEGAKDKAPMLYNGEIIGDNKETEMDIAVDPVEGTRLVAKGLSNALSVIAIAPRGCLLKAPDMYMFKIAVGPEAKGVIDIDASPTENLIAVAEAKGESINNMTVVVLDRPRHQDIIAELYEIGARIKLISDGDVAAGISTALPETGIDMLIGIGGAPEGVLTAVALKCLGGDMQTKLYPRNQKDIDNAKTMGIEDIKKIYTLDDLVKGNDIIFTATGITGGEFLDKVVFKVNKAATNSLLLDGLNEEILRINTIHNLDKSTSKVNKIG